MRTVNRLEEEIERYIENTFNIVKGSNSLTRLFINDKSLDSVFNGKSIEESLESNYETPVESNYESSDGIPGILGISFPNNSNETFEKVKGLYDTLCSIGVKEGFINHLNLTDELVYPLISNYIPALLNFQFGIDQKVKGKERLDIIKDRHANPLDFYKDIIWNKWSNSERFKHFNYLVNLILLNILTVSYNCLSKLKDNKDNEDFYLICSFKNLIKLCTGRLDLDIRKQLKRRSVKMNKNVMAGFDTESQNIDIAKMELLTSQLAVTGCLEIVIPKFHNYKPHGINANNGIEYPLSRHPKGLDGKVIEGFIDDSMYFIRNKIFGKQDIMVDKFKDYLIEKCRTDEKEIKEGLKDKALTCIETDNEFIFRTGYYQIKSSVEVVKKLNFEILINKITSSLNDKLEKEINSLNDGFKKESCFEENTAGDLEFVLPSNEKFVYTSRSKGTTKGININPVNPFNLKSLIDKNEVISLEMNLSPSNPSNLTKDLFSNPVEDFSSLIKRKNVKGMNVRITNNVYLFAHYNSADFCFFNDLEKIKDKIFIIDKSFVTMGNRLKVGNWNVNIRDTSLLASAAEPGEISNMRQLMIDNPSKFLEYAINDSYITLIHGLFMSNFMLETIHINKIPVTLGNVTKSYCHYKWRKSGYEGYQLNPEYLLSDPISNSPKALNLIGSNALNMNLFVATYKGGRNESYMYGLEEKLLHGFDDKEQWFDYDLQGCYSTCMSMLGDPDYRNATMINSETIDKMEEEELRSYLFKSYTSMIVNFEFPKSVKFPNIPVQADKNVTIYPLSGKDVAVEGREFWLAKKLGCKLEIKQGYCIPYRYITNEDGKSKVLAPGPFTFIGELQQLRKEAKAIWGKGSAMEKIYKDIGNMTYGLTGQGITYKKKYDLRTQTHKPISGSEITNPAIASAITAMARCTVSEMMNNTASLDTNNKILSVTTDGFITNVLNLEKTLIENTSLDSTFLNMYRIARIDLGHKPSKINDELATEVKTNVENFISSWATRGQFGSDNIELNSRKPDIVAMTGYQRSGKGSAELKSLIVDSLSSPNKSIHFMQKSLIGARQVLEKGSQVTYEYGERVFRALYDNRRVIIVPKDIERYYESTKGIKYINYAKVEGGLLLDTLPHKNVEDARFMRATMNRMKNPIYQKYNTFKLLPKMNDTADICIRWLCRWFLKYGVSLLLTREDFIDDILFPLIKNSTTIIRKSKDVNRKYISYINSLKLQGSYIPNSIPKNKISEQFLDSLLNYIRMLPCVGKYILHKTLGNIRNEFFESTRGLSLIALSQPIFVFDTESNWRKFLETHFFGVPKSLSLITVTKPFLELIPVSQPIYIDRISIRESNWWKNLEAEERESDFQCYLDFQYSSNYL